MKFTVANIVNEHVHQSWEQSEQRRIGDLADGKGDQTEETEWKETLTASQFLINFNN